jgi:Family of unknown function (DUF5829)
VTTQPKAISRRPRPCIDHVMVLVDTQTYQQVSASGFIAERFGRIKEKKADSSVAGQYSTLGIAGDNSLIELFNAEMPGDAPLRGGLVFSFEEPGAAKEARALLDASGTVKYHHDLVTRAVEGSAPPQPWYHLISVDLGEGSPLLLFLNEVTQTYFTAVGAKPAADGALRRRDYLNAVVGAPASGSLLMRDIAGVTLAVQEERARRIAEALSVFGFRAIQQAEGLELRGPELTVRLRVGESAQERVTEIQVQLSTGEYEPTQLSFGHASRLILDPGGTARWLFAGAGLAGTS